MKLASIGEMPPRTRGNVGLTSRIARPAAFVISAKRFQPGSSSGSQCDLLLGSFQILTASIIAFLPLADRQDRQPGHARRAGTSKPRPPDGRLRRTLSFEAGLQRRPGSVSTSLWDRRRNDAQ